MMEEKEQKIFTRVKEHYQELEKRGYEIVAVFLQGSQNYHLDEYSEEYMSDVDTKAIVLPRFDDFVTNKKPTTTTIILENQEHIETKDIRLMLDLFLKQNISYLELLYTKYYVVNPKYEEAVRMLRESRDLISAYDIKSFVRGIVGMAREKQNSLCHPYPSIAWKIERYGFDGKQLSHCARLVSFLEKFSVGKSIEECFDETENWLLRNYKKFKGANGEILTPQEAEELCDMYVEIARAKRDWILNEYKEQKPNEKVIELLTDVKRQVLTQWFKEELSTDGKN